MGREYAILAGMLIVAVIAAFPLAIGVCAAAGGALAAVDRLLNYHPAFARLRRGLNRRQYRVGRTVTRFLAPDVRRDVQVVDVSQIDEGIVSARVRTWNALYVSKRLAEMPPFGEVQTFEIQTLWTLSETACTAVGKGAHQWDAP